MFARCKPDTRIYAQKPETSWRTYRYMQKLIGIRLKIYPFRAPLGRNLGLKIRFRLYSGSILTVISAARPNSFVKLKLGANCIISSLLRTLFTFLSIYIGVKEDYCSLCSYSHPSALKMDIA